MRMLVVALALAGCGAEQVDCDNARSTAGENGGDNTEFEVVATKCADGVDKGVACELVDGAWSCVCFTGDEEGVSLSDPDAFRDEARDPNAPSGISILGTVADECGWETVR